MGQILTYPLTSKLYQRHGNEQLRVGVSEMQGYRVNMEDQHTVKLSLSKKHPNLSFFSVFDGHAGDRASIYLAEHLWERVGNLEKPTDATQLVDAVLKLDADFLTRKEERTHGSTAVFVVVEPGTPATAAAGTAAGAAASSSTAAASTTAASTAAASETGKDAKSDASSSSSSSDSAAKPFWRITVGNIGDSRAVLIRKSGECISLTEDHKPNALAEAERIRAAGGFVSSNRVDGQLAMSRAIGDWSYKGDTALHVTKQKVIAVPDITIQRAEEGDMLLVCCDGIVEQMKNEDAASFIMSDLAANGRDPAVLSGRLLDQALKTGSKDNMTAMIIQFGVDGRPYNNPKDEYVPGPYWPENREFVDAFKSDARRHGLDGAALEAFIAKAKEVPKPEGARGGGGGGGGMGGLASILARAGAGGAGPPGGGAGGAGGDDDDDDGPIGMGMGGGGGAGGAGLDLNALSQRDQLRALMELLQKGGAGPAGAMMDGAGEDEDDEDDEPPAAAGKGKAGAGAAGKANGGAGAAAASAAAASPSKNAKKNAKKRAKKKGKAAAASGASGASGSAPPAAAEK